MLETSEFVTLREKSGLSIEETAILLGKSARTIRRYEAKGETKICPPALIIDAMRNATINRSQQNGNQGGFDFIDLFAGIGGIRRPFEEIGGHCVFTSEWDRFAQETYDANFPSRLGHESIGDIRPVANDPGQIPRHDLLLAGFPCQPFSIAGVSKKNSLGKPHGFLCDTQGTLFYDLAKIIEYHKPPVFVLENVKNIKRHDGGRTFSTIRHVLESELGYKIHTKIISSDAWVPQKRERIFIVGFKESSSFNFNELELPNGRKPRLGDILDPVVDPKYTLTEKLWNYLISYKEKHNKAGNGFGYSLFGPEDTARTLSARYYKDGSEILIQQNRMRPRRLTPRECARLMGFDGPGESSFIIPVSDTQAYRQFGNSVVVPVVRAVADLLKPHLLEALASNEQIDARVELPLVKMSG